MATPTLALVTALSRAAACLDTEGLAVGVRGEPRVTRDVDLVLPVEDDADAEQRVFLLQRHGFLVDSVFDRAGGRLSTVRLPDDASVEAARQEMIQSGKPWVAVEAQGTFLGLVTEGDLARQAAVVMGWRGRRRN